MGVAVAINIITYDTTAYLGDSTATIGGGLIFLAGQVADYLVTIKEIRASFLFYYTDKGLCLSARSDGSVNVQVVMEALGGGGHLTVAGAQLGKEGNRESAEKVIISQVRKQIKEEKE